MVSLAVTRRQGRRTLVIHATANGRKELLPEQRGPNITVELSGTRRGRDELGVYWQAVLAFAT